MPNVTDRVPASGITWRLFDPCRSDQHEDCVAEQVDEHQHVLCGCDCHVLQDVLDAGDEPCPRPTDAVEEGGAA